MATGNTNFGVDGLLATTIDHYIRKMEEQAWNKTVLMHILSDGGISAQHGNQIVVPLLYGETSAKGSFADTDVFAAPTRDGISAAEFPFRQYYASIMISGIEIAKNSGAEAILSLLESRMRQAELTIAKNMNAMLFADGTGNSNKDFLGLAAVVANGNVFGGIDRADVNNGWWDASVTPQGGVLTLAGLRTKYNDVTNGVDKPTHIITTQAGFEAYEALLTSNVRYQDTRLGDAGFDSLMFKSAPIVFDRDCTAQTFYFLNKGYLDIVSLDGKWFDVSDWLRPVNQDVQYKNILLYGNLTCSNSSLQGSLTGVTDA